ncbi:hydrogenase 3 maturation endopeptidase HyCI [Candidatus Bipolaricaulota bacterium]
MKRVLLGVGSRLSRDDGVGPAVARAMDGADGWMAIDCGTALENASGIVAREEPDLLVIVDAARMGLPPGSIRRLPIDSTDRMLASTHGLPLSFVIERLGGAVQGTVLIGIEPEDLTFGEGISEQVSKAADALAKILRGGDVEQIPALEASGSD